MTDFLLDDDADGAPGSVALPQGELPTMRAVLNAYGVPDDAIDAAEEDGTLGYLAMDRLVFPDPPIYDLTSLSEVTGMPAEQIAQLWRSLGFPDPTGGERLFTETDADMLHTVAGLMELGLIEPDLVVQMSRVIGSSLARVASAMIEAIGLDAENETSDDEEFAVAAGTLMPTMPKVMDYVWRRHLQAAARRRVAAPVGGDGLRAPKTVGFADLVGFTALSQQIDEHELADMVDRFETLAYDTVVGQGGRVVKMIGDEVMFVVDDVRAGAEIALSLAEVYGQDTELSDVRVGLATGPALEREADYFGPTVNLASRIVNIAFPGSVVVSDEVHTALEGDPGFAWRFLKQRRLKDIGKVPLWSMQRAEPDQPARDEKERATPREKARRRHTERREQRLEKLEAPNDPAPTDGPGSGAADGRTASHDT